MKLGELNFSEIETKHCFLPSFFLLFCFFNYQFIEYVCEGVEHRANNE